MPEFQQPDPSVEGFVKALEQSRPQQETPAVELPRYRCHKEVHAMKIGQVLPDPFEPEPEPGSGSSHSGLLLVPEDRTLPNFRVTAEFNYKHDPQPGGYLVIYEDGYQSFSPAEAFEKGYSRI